MMACLLDPTGADLIEFEVVVVGLETWEEEDCGQETERGGDQRLEDWVSLHEETLLARRTVERVRIIVIFC